MTEAVFLQQKCRPRFVSEVLPSTLKGKEDIIFSNIQDVDAFHRLHLLPQLKERATTTVEAARVFIECVSHPWSSLAPSPPLSNFIPHLLPQITTPVPAPTLPPFVSPSLPSRGLWKAVMLVYMRLLCVGCDIITLAAPLPYVHIQSICTCDWKGYVWNLLMSRNWQTVSKNSSSRCGSCYWNVQIAYPNPKEAL